MNNKIKCPVCQKITTVTERNYPKKGWVIYCECGHYELVRNVDVTIPHSVAAKVRGMGEHIERMH